jgi:hypothetical protein
VGIPGSLASAEGRYTAVVRMRRGTTVLHLESKTFAHRSAAITSFQKTSVVFHSDRTRMSHVKTPTQVRGMEDDPPSVEPSRSPRAQLPAA